MSKIVRFSHPGQMREQIRQQACAWMVELDAGMGAQDRKRLAAWLREHPAHARALLDAARMWDQMDMLSGLADLFPLEQYVAERNRWSLRARVVAGLAAGLAVLALSGTLILGVSPGGPEDATMVASEVFATAIGEQTTVQLPDGSEVVLNTDSVLEVRYSESERQVVLLRGEGFFSVAPQTRPFRVRAGTRMIEAVGTSFTVKVAARETIEVLVTDGEVSLLRAATSGTRTAATEEEDETRSRAARLSLVAGEYASVNERSEAIQMRLMAPEEIEARLTWRHGMLLFQGDPLEVVLREVGRYTTVRIEAAEEIRDLPVVGYFRAGDVDRLLAAMRENFQIVAQRMEDDRILLTAQ